ncbi:response regulator [Sinomicrobium soli]|uniref:response regulator transcription factor n=1 Tax=Sinomicrobium sp. N-1-3-6 TaxID=2219864 RepID=UPI000DCDF389|nr:response regulator transcription factor [Sinomicrobium sp. N-1-3-6]RAV29213.1 hypothetical protein DN748_09855 [Sinomicrobium sp. N-1-3-6]
MKPFTVKSHDTNRNNYAVILIDDNRLATWMLRKILHRIGKRENISFQIREATSIAMALLLIEQISCSHNVSYIFLNLQMPSISDGTIISGERLARTIQQKYPDSKLVLSTSYHSPYHIYALLDEVSPEGLLIKKDMDYYRSILILRAILLCPPYLSPTAARIIEEGGRDRYTLQKWDRNILYELSQGATLSDLEAEIPMGRSTIVRHRNNLKLHLGLTVEATDRTLVIAARKKGII